MCLVVQWDLPFSNLTLSCNVLHPVVVIVVVVASTAAAAAATASVDVVAWNRSQFLEHFRS